MSVKYTDNSDEVLSAFERAMNNALTKIGMQAESYAKEELTRKVYTRSVIGDKHKYRLTGRLRNSVTFAITGREANIESYTDNDGNEYSYQGKMPEEEEKAVYIGSNVEYAA